MLTSELSRWLLSPEAGNLAPTALIDGLAQRLIAAGFPLWRLNAGTHSRHPEVAALLLRWSGETGTEIRPVTHAQRRAAQQASPITPVLLVVSGGHPEFRCRLEAGEAIARYSALRTLGEQGGGDYVLLPLHFAQQGNGFISFATPAGQSFTPAQLEELRALLPILTLRIELLAAQLTTRGLLEVYLGPNAAQRVLSGAVERGHGERIHAAIWYCDLRGFTSLADRTPVSELIALLDRYFERVAGPVRDSGGEILKFIGDAMLAVYAVGADGPEQACRRALGAAQEAVAQVAGLNPELPAGSARLEIGVALHLGEVMYGNIGARERLDFTVIGSAVNEVCRVESLCKELRAPVLLTRPFAEAVGPEGLISLGAHALRGVSEPHQLFAPAPRPNS